MAINDEMWVIGLGLLFTYIVLYKRNKFFGNIGFIGISIALMSYSTDNVYSAVGLIMLLGSIINTISDILTTRVKK